MFEKLYEELVRKLENCVDIERKLDLINEFCEIFPNFDSSKLDKYV